MYGSAGATARGQRKSPHEGGPESMASHLQEQSVFPMRCAELTASCGGCAPAVMNGYKPGTIRPEGRGTFGLEQLH
jgi:hypothetical protein